MKDTPTSPTALELLGAELRRARDLADMSGRELARLVGISQSKVSRIESGTSLPSVPQVMAWAEAVAAGPEAARRLADLTGAALEESRVHVQDKIADMETRARLIRAFQTSLVPGLLQTAEYARRVFTLFDPPYAKSHIPKVLAGRLDRQLALFDETRSFEFLITEAALRWRPGPPGLLRAQLDRIASLSSLSNVRIGLIPLAVEATVSLAHSFVIFEMRPAGLSRPDGSPGAEPDGSPGFVIVETSHANLTIRDPSAIVLYRRRWELLAAMASYGDEARAFLAHISSSLAAAD